jgi:hypothetical protein
MNDSDDLRAAWRELQAFLLRCYSDDELRERAGDVFDDIALVSRLPGTKASVQDLASQFVSLLQRAYPAPPPHLWTCLRATRPHRIADIEALRARFEHGTDVREPRSAPSPASTPTSAIRLLEGPAGSFDLLELVKHWRSQHMTEPPALLSPLTPGTVNGLRRALKVAWTSRMLTIEAKPSLLCEHDRMPNPIVLATPVKPTRLRYFPNGRNFYREGRPPPEVHLIVDAWDGHDRRLLVADPTGIEEHEIVFAYPERQPGR